eukprot:828996_1
MSQSHNANNITPHADGNMEIGQIFGSYHHHEEKNKTESTAKPNSAPNDVIKLLINFINALPMLNIIPAIYCIIFSLVTSIGAVECQQIVRNIYENGNSIQEVVLSLKFHLIKALRTKSIDKPAETIKQSIEFARQQVEKIQTEHRIFMMFTMVQPSHWTQKQRGRFCTLMGCNQIQLSLVDEVIASNDHEAIKSRLARESLETQFLMW